jgi:VWFA-related protein
MRHCLSISAVVPLVISLLAGPLRAASPFPADDRQNTVTIKSHATLVQVPAVVTDKSGKHLHGLTKNDFHVFEDGVEQQIAVFEEVATSNPHASGAVNTPNAFTNLRSGSNALIIVFDEINTNFNDQQSARANLIKYLTDSLAPKQSIAVMVMSDKGVKKFPDRPMTAPL